MVGVLSDDTDPMVTVMKLEKAPTESYADIGGLDTQIQEIKESVELPLTHPEYYEEMGIKPPKVSTVVMMCKMYNSMSRVSSCMVLLALARPSWPRLWLTRPVPPSLEW